MILFFRSWAEACTTSSNSTDSCWGRQSITWVNEQREKVLKAEARARSRAWAARLKEFYVERVKPVLLAWRRFDLRSEPRWHAGRWRAVYMMI